MAQQTIDNGETGLVVREKINDNFTEIYNNSRSRTVLSADVVNNNAIANTIADVTGLSFPVVAGTSYHFKFFIVYTSASVNTGSRWSINGPATPTFLAFDVEWTLTSTSKSYSPARSSYDAPVSANANSTAAPEPNIAVIEGVITPSVDGIVIARFASEVSGSAITAKQDLSYVEYVALT